MELPSEIYRLFEKIDEEPGLLVAFAAFHPLALGILWLPFHLLNKYIFKIKINYESNLYQLFAMIFAIGWIGGFVLTILMMFSGVPGIKMLLIYFAIYLCAAGFVFSVPGQLVEKFEKDSEGNLSVLGKNLKKKR